MAADEDDGGREVIAAEGEGKLGLKFGSWPPVADNGDRELEITFVAPESWGARNNIEVGWCIVEANGAALAEMDWEGFKKALAVRPLSLYILPPPDEEEQPASPPPAPAPPPKPEPPPAREPETKAPQPAPVQAAPAPAAPTQAAPAQAPPAASGQAVGRLEAELDAARTLSDRLQSMLAQEETLAQQATQALAAADARARAEAGKVQAAEAEAKEAVAQRARAAKRERAQEAEAETEAKEVIALRARLEAGDRRQPSSGDQAILPSDGKEKRRLQEAEEEVGSLQVQLRAESAVARRARRSSVDGGAAEAARLKDRLLAEEDLAGEAKSSLGQLRGQLRREESQAAQLRVELQAAGGSTGQGAADAALQARLMAEQAEVQDAISSAQAEAEVAKKARAGLARAEAAETASARELARFRRASAASPSVDSNPEAAKALEDALQQADALRTELRGEQAALRRAMRTSGNTPAVGTGSAGTLRAEEAAYREESSLARRLQSNLRRHEQENLGSEVSELQGLCRAEEATVRAQRRQQIREYQAGTAEELRDLRRELRAEEAAVRAVNRQDRKAFVNWRTEAEDAATAEQASLLRAERAAVRGLRRNEAEARACALRADDALVEEADALRSALPHEQELARRLLSELASLESSAAVLAAGDGSQGVAELASLGRQLSRAQVAFSEVEARCAIATAEANEWRVALTTSSVKELRTEVSLGRSAEAVLSRRCAEHEAQVWAVEVTSAAEATEVTALRASLLEEGTRVGELQHRFLACEEDRGRATSEASALLSAQKSRAPELQSVRTLLAVEEHQLRQEMASAKALQTCLVGEEREAARLRHQLVLDGHGRGRDAAETDLARAGLAREEMQLVRLREQMKHSGQEGVREAAEASALRSALLVEEAVAGRLQQQCFLAEQGCGQATTESAALKNALTQERAQCRTAQAEFKASQAQQRAAGGVPAEVWRPPAAKPAANLGEFFSAQVIDDVRAEREAEELAALQQRLAEAVQSQQQTAKLAGDLRQRLKQEEEETRHSWSQELAASRATEPELRSALAAEREAVAAQARIKDDLQLAESTEIVLLRSSLTQEETAYNRLRREAFSRSLQGDPAYGHMGVQTDSQNSPRQQQATEIAHLRVTLDAERASAAARLRRERQEVAALTIRAALREEEAAIRRLARCYSEEAVAQNEAATRRATASQNHQFTEELARVKLELREALRDKDSGRALGDEQSVVLRAEVAAAGVRLAQLEEDGDRSRRTLHNRAMEEEALKSQLVRAVQDRDAAVSQQAQGAQLEHARLAASTMRAFQEEQTAMEVVVGKHLQESRSLESELAGERSEAKLALATCQGRLRSTEEALKVAEARLAGARGECQEAVERARGVQALEARQSVRCSGIEAERDAADARRDLAVRAEAQATRAEAQLLSQERAQLAELHAQHVEDVQVASQAQAQAQLAEISLVGNQDREEAALGRQAKEALDKHARTAAELESRAAAWLVAAQQQGSLEGEQRALGAEAGEMQWYRTELAELRQVQAQSARAAAQAVLSLQLSETALVSTEARETATCELEAQLAREASAAGARVVEVGAAAWLPLARRLGYEAGEAAGEAAEAVQIGFETREWRRRAATSDVLVAEAAALKSQTLAAEAEADACREGLRKEAVVVERAQAARDGARATEAATLRSALVEVRSEAARCSAIARGEDQIAAKMRRYRALAEVRAGEVETLEERLAEREALWDTAPLEEVLRNARPRGLGDVVALPLAPPEAPPLPPAPGEGVLGSRAAALRAEAEDLRGEVQRFQTRRGPPRLGEDAWGTGG